MRWTSTLLLLVAALQVECAVISIDFGTEWVKVGLISINKKFETIMNRDSKRKSMAVITMRDNERTYSYNGQALSMRFPKDSISRPKLLLGKIFDSSAGEKYRQIHFGRVKACPIRQTFLFETDKGTEHTVEELLAMKFQYIQEDVKTETGDLVKDAVITVPSFFHQYERQAILDAAHIAGIKVLALINDGSAVALNYAMTRKFSETPQHHIIYDMGSGSTVATVVTFQEITTQEGKYRRNVTYTQVEIQGTGYDRELGGIVFEERIQNILTEKFTAKNPHLTQTLKESPRALLKLQKESNRIKHILSANNDASCTMESLVEDTDLRTFVSRTDFEEAASDLFTRILTPIQDALSQAKLTINDIESIILFGGAVRVPKVLNTLKEFAGSEKISQNVNSDEAASIGASFRGAALSSQFKVKDVRLKERTLYGIDLLVSPESEDLETQGRRFTLFEPNSPVVEGRYLPVKLTTDFDFRVQYSESSSPLGSHECPVLAVGKVRGLAQYNEKFGDRILDSPKLRVLVSMNPSGIVSILKAQAIYQLKPEELPEDVNKDSNDTAKDKAEKKKQVTEKVNLELTYEQVCFPPMTKELKDQAIQRLDKLNTLDKERYARDEARNNLESFVYSIGDYLDKDEVAEITSKDERQALLKSASDASKWLSDHAEDASKSELDSQLAPLEKLKKPIVARFNEYLKRPEAIKSFRTSLSELESYITTMTKAVTEANLEILAPTLKKIRDGAAKEIEWLEEREQAQSKLFGYEKPVFTIKEIKRHQKDFDDLKFTLMREIIALPPPPPPPSKEEPKEETTEKESETKASETEASLGSDSADKDEL